MKSNNPNHQSQCKRDESLDSLIAHLNIMTTDFIFSGHTCRGKASAIVNQLQDICQHIESMFFPEQRMVYYKMLKVWQSLANQANQKNSKKQ